MPTIPLVKEWRNIFTRMEYTSATGITPEQTAQYEKAIDILSGYSGLPETLVETFKAFLDTKTRAYVLAGAAQVMATAAYLYSDNYDPEGIQEALRLLEQAQAVDSTRQEINLVEAQIYINAQRLNDARAVLDHLHDGNAELTYQFCRTELWFWDIAHNPKQVQRWYKLAMEQAQSENQQFFLLRRIGSFYLDMNQYEECIEVYQKLLAINPAHAWTWHNMSIALYELERYTEAADANRRALKIMKFGAAQGMKQAIDKKRPWFDKLFDLFRV